MSMVIARIVLRYLSGALVAYGWLDHGMAEQIALDPDLAIALGALIGVASEALYLVAKRNGGAT